MKALVLQLLRDHHGEYLSGEKISEHLKCSRTMVWKYIDALRKEGYEIEALSNNGYRLLGDSDNISEHEIFSRLDDSTFVTNVVYKESTHSTQQIAHTLVNEGAQAGTIVIANEQTSGRGRLGREWYSPSNTGIWMSIIIKPEIDIRQAPQLTLVTAVAVTRAIQRSCGIEVDIKWPNDILLNGKKLAGILTEMQADPDQIRSVIIGIGINVNQINFPSSLEGIATSLMQETNKQHLRSTIIANLLNEFQWLYDTYLTKGFSLIKPLWEARSITIGKEVTVKTNKKTIAGFAEGITDDGVLIIRDKQEVRHRVYSGDIHLSND